MSKAPTETVLAVIRWHITKIGYAPTVTELAVELDVARSTIHEALVALEAEGRIRRAPRSARAIQIIDQVEPRCPLCGGADRADRGDRAEWCAHPWHGKAEVPA